MLCFTYHRAIPEVIEFLFAFGFQSDAQDPYFSSFFQRTCLSTQSSALAIPELAWSGYEIQMCYNLRSVEKSGSDPRDWSIRPCAVHHTLDMRNIRASWIVIKGNGVIQKRIEQATHGRDYDAISSFETLDRAFVASLSTHLVFCDWAAEQWRWYINNLEDQFQNTSKKALTAPVTRPSSSLAAHEEFRRNSRTGTQKSHGSFAARISRTGSMLTEKFSVSSAKPTPPTQRTYTDLETGLSQPLPPHIKVREDSDVALEQPQPEPTFESSEEEDFSFAKLQTIQHIEEKAHGALLILKMNVNVISQLKQYYDTITKSSQFPKEIRKLCLGDLEQFELRINGILNDFQMRVLRLDTLLRLLGDRKALVHHVIHSVDARLNNPQLHSILEYQNTQTNKKSTKNMMSMTEDMNDIARKTKIETVSMKVITVVTLFFLPGTFISVCVIFFVSKPTFGAYYDPLTLLWHVHRQNPEISRLTYYKQTLMSTDIFNLDNDLTNPGPNPYAHLSPLQLYLAASLPLTFVTILVWAALHWLEKHKESLKARAHHLESVLEAGVRHH